MIDANELRKSVTFELDGNLYKVLDYHHHKPGRGAATIRIKARNMITGATIDKTFSSGERVQDVQLEYKNVQYLYTDGEFYYFMDNQTFDQPAVQGDVLSEVLGYLKEGLEVKLTYFNDSPIDIELPTSVDLNVTEAAAAVKGDTATGVTKKVKLETGTEVSVPNFIVEGDLIRVDTRNGTYLTRVTE
jgi:elongation factor P